MKFLLCNLVFLLVIHVNFAQSIHGKLLDATTKEPIVGANVFIANTSVGAVSNEKGEFLISKSPQKSIDLVCSMIGYETIAIPILLDTLGNKPLIFFLKEKVDKIEGITVQAKNPNWQNNYNLFKLHFLGETENAKNCVIKNPEILNFKYQKRVFNALADDMLIVENKNLGYIIKYKLSSFIVDFEKGYFVILGYPLFELMKGSKSQEKRWKKRRLETYLGSSLHLMRSLYNNNWDTEGFMLRRLERKPNPDRLPDSLIKMKLRKFLKENKQDSIKYWIKQQKVPLTLQILHSNLLKPSDSLVTQNREKLKKLTFSDCMQINYQPKNSKTEKIQTSVITFFKPFVLLQEDGYVIETLDLIYEGYMPLKKVADLLPLDYQKGQ